MLQNHQKSKGSFPFPLGSQVKEPPAKPSARPVPAPYPDDPYVVTRDVAIDAASVATSNIDDDDDDTAPMDSQPYEPQEEEEDPEEDLEGDDDEDMEMDDEAKVIDPYMDDGSNNPPPPNSEDEETLLLLPLSLMLVVSLSLLLLHLVKTFILIEKLMSKRIDIEGRVKKKFKEQDRHFVGSGCDNIKMDRMVRNVMSDLSGLKKKSTRGNLPSSLIQDTINQMIQECVEAAIRAERDRVQNEANHAGGPNVASVTQECTFTDFMKCSPITFCGNEGAVGLIRWIEKTEMVFTVSKCTEANKLVFAAATFQDWALTWWNSHVATLGIEVVTMKTWAEMKVMMTEEFCPLKEIQRMECELWNLRVKEMDISSYTIRFNELVILCPGMVPTKRKKKVKPIAEREADNKKRKWENFQGGSSSGGGNSNRRSRACGQAYALRYGDQNFGPNVVTVIEKEPAERRLKDVPVICKFLDVFPEDLPGLPPP
nr:hypothetical protein [Tanacetum cinerariifolium]